MTLWLLLGNWTGRGGGVQAGALCQAPESLWRTCAQLCAGTKTESLEVQPLPGDGIWGKGSIPEQAPSSGRILSLTSGFSARSTGASRISLAGKGHGGGATHAREDTSPSTSAPVSFSSARRPILVSGNDHPQEGRAFLPGGRKEGASPRSTVSTG